VPNHWTKLGQAEELADPADKTFRNKDTGELFVLGKAHKNATKEEIARWYGVRPDDVTFPLEEE
jgi:hypothetical protein